jgi:hypothetical protein
VLQKAEAASMDGTGFLVALDVDDQTALPFRAAKSPVRAAPPLSTPLPRKKPVETDLDATTSIDLGMLEGPVTPFVGAPAVEEPAPPAHAEPPHASTSRPAKHAAPAPSVDIPAAPLPDVPARPPREAQPPPAVLLSIPHTAEDTNATALGVAIISEPALPFSQEKALPGAAPAPIHREDPHPDVGATSDMIPVLMDAPATPFEAPTSQRAPDETIKSEEASSPEPQSPLPLSPAAGTPPPPATSGAATPPPTAGETAYAMPILVLEPATPFASDRAAPAEPTSPAPAGPSSPAPADPGSPAPAPAGMLTLEQYAAVRVELELRPAETATVLAQYQISHGRLQELDAHFRALFARDSAFRESWFKAYSDYKQWWLATHPRSE